jgi:hypothetical protein
MVKRTNRGIVLVALLVVAALACSPQAVLVGLVGESPTQTPTVKVAQAQTLTPVLVTATPSPSAPATTPNPTATAGASNTPAPVLPLRDDLPTLALRDWPRPANDNGRCIHFLPTGYYTQADFNAQLPRMVDLQMRWVLAIYSDENQLRVAAQNFKKAGIVPVWRRLLQSYQHYYAWDRDIKILSDAGLPPYFQLYNEPDNPDEWGGHEVDMNQWVDNFVTTAKDVYNAGGYVGLQVTDTDLLATVLRRIKAQKGERLFQRMFFVPHNYALNHPPSYVEDENAVLGFRMFVDVFQKEIGFVPPFIVGEGGWKIGEEQDNRFPKVDDAREANYYVELFNWFRPGGKLSNGEPLPDYLFAFCPWLIAGHTTAGAWYDGFEGERTSVIQAVTKMGTFTRKFSWDKK